jgi:hypothetical protein
MSKPLDRMWTIERINRSISESHSWEQVESTEHFLALYYKTFPFDPTYFVYEWMLDTQLSVRKVNLAILVDDNKPIMMPTNNETISLKRLDEYIQSLSLKELQQEWPNLHLQLRGIDLSKYPAMCEKISCLKSTSGRYEYQNVKQVLKVA